MRCLLYVSIGLTMLSCGGLVQNLDSTAATIHKAGKQTREVVMPQVNEECRRRALACRDAGDTTCLPLIKCDQVRTEVATLFVSIQEAAKLTLSIKSMVTEMGVVP